MKKIVFAFVITVIVAACNTATDKSTTQKNNIPDTSIMATKPADSLAAYTADMLDSKKDHVCGMPVSAGISDTAHYKGKVYGFCSKECKDEFVKTPDKYLSTK
jgi:YHS domain-containing protein